MTLTSCDPTVVNDPVTADQFPVTNSPETSANKPAQAVHAFAVAPMMEMTDRYCRYFHHQLSRKALLYSEMVTTNAIIFGDREHLLGFDMPEGARPPVLQLGGSDPDALAECAGIGQQFGYQQINMNVGCPSDRVQSGRFGACLMAEPTLVADCVRAMRKEVDVPVTVKCRIGIDREDSYQLFSNFVETVAGGGCDTFVVHARKAWLYGLSPKENRELPPLRYEFVQRIKAEMPELTFVLNGGLRTHDQSRPFLEESEHKHHEHWNAEQMSSVRRSPDQQSPDQKNTDKKQRNHSSKARALDGVMWGREAYRNPWLLAEVDTLYYGEPAQKRSRFDLVGVMLPYIESSTASGVPLGRITRHMLGLFQAQPGGRLWRRHLSENSWKKGAGVEVVADALRHVERAASKAA